MGGSGFSTVALIKKNIDVPVKWKGVSPVWFQGLRNSCEKQAHLPDD